MTEFSGLFAAVRRVATNPVEDRAAVRHILWRVDNGLLTHEDALEALQMAGLVDTPKTSPQIAAGLNRSRGHAGHPERAAETNSGRRTGIDGQPGEHTCT